MRSFAPGLMKLTATVIFFAVAQGMLLGADQNQLPPSKRNAPKGQMVQFSDSSSTSPVLPKPTPRADELTKREGFVSDNGSAINGVATVAPGTQQAPQMSKALAERMLQQLDRRKNWMIPGAQDAELTGMMSEWMQQGFEKKDADDITDDKKQSVMERFLRSSDKKNKANNRKSGDDEKRSDPDDNFKEDRTPAEMEKKTRNEESGAITDFSLKGALKAPQKNEFTKDATTRANTFRPDFAQENRSPRDREVAKEREAIRAAEFQQLLRPRTPGAASVFGSVPDPINSAPDYTRREMNPILPRAADPAPSAAQSSGFSSSFGSAFGGSAGSGFNPPDRSSMFGVVAPSAPSFNSAPAPALVQPANTFRPASSIILEPPKRPF